MDRGGGLRSACFGRGDSHGPEIVRTKPTCQLTCLGSLPPHMHVQAHTSPHDRHTCRSMMRAYMNDSFQNRSFWNNACSRTTSCEGVGAWGAERGGACGGCADWTRQAGARFPLCSCCATSCRFAPVLGLLPDLGASPVIRWGQLALVLILVGRDETVGALDVCLFVCVGGGCACLFVWCL